MEQRIIKFKAKRLDNNEWITGDLLQVSEKDVQIYNKDCGGSDHPVDPSTVCQFVGLRDIEGKGIFENDLLTKDGTVVYKVGYVNCGFAASYEDEDDFSLNLLAISKYCRICGNEFDRKEGEYQH